MLAAASAIGLSHGSINAQHATAEKLNRLFTFCHAALGVTATELFSKTEREAFISGVRAYEVVGLGQLTTDEHRRYSMGYALAVLSEFEPDGNFGLHFLEAADKSRTELIAETPRLAEAVGIIASREITDTSTELAKLSLSGAGIMRASQLEIDELLEFEAAFDA